MAVNLVRQESDTPTITNKDDARMIRYAYGGYNGVVKGFGNECGYTSDNGIFKVLDGRIVIDGWEIDIDGLGWQLNLSNVTGIQYHSIYAQIDVLVETVDIKSSYSTGSYPTIEKGNDLTAIPNGTARLLLYNVQVENGAIKNVIKKFEIIPYLVQDIEKLKSGEIKAGNSKKVNDLELKKDENGVLRVGNTIIPQKKLLWQGEVSLSSGGNNTTYFFTHSESLKGKKLQIEARKNSNKLFFTFGLNDMVTIPLCVQANEYYIYVENLFINIASNNETKLGALYSYYTCALDGREGEKGEGDYGVKICAVYEIIE